MTGRFLAAIQFLTVLPVRRDTGRAGRGAVFYPLVGALLGASAGAVLMLSEVGLGRPLSALLALGWLLVVTGCLHEDGLADVADAVRAGRTREKMMAILKDSRIGTYGAVALIISVAVRWQAMAEMAQPMPQFIAQPMAQLMAQLMAQPVAGLAAAVSLSRMSLVALAGIAPAVGSGMGQAFALDCSRKVVSLVVVQAVAMAGAAAWFTGWRPALGMIAATALVVLLARAYFVRRLGGVNGDCLGATCQVVEMVNLVILAWRFST